MREVASGRVAPEAAVDRLRSLPYEQIEGATIDHHRALRTGHAEVIFCQGKTPRQVADIFERLAAQRQAVLATRAEADHYRAVAARLPQAEHHESARCITLASPAAVSPLPGVTIVCAGTSDLPVAEEAAVTLRTMGHEPERLTDVGVAGLHRLLPHVPALRRSNVIITVAGMEGALPSVVAGLVSAPVVAVPTSVGYGASFQGLAALLAMLNSCAAGVSVVNIDNGFGAAMVAAAVNRRIHGAHA